MCSLPTCVLPLTAPAWPTSAASSTGERRSCLDRSFQLELAFLQGSAGAAVNSIVRQAVLDILLTPEKEQSLQGAATAIGAFKTQCSVGYTSGESRDEVTTILDVIAKMRLNVSPKPELRATFNPNYQRCFLLLPNFPVHENPKAGGEAAATLFGRDAVNASTMEWQRP